MSIVARPSVHPAGAGPELAAAPGPLGRLPPLPRAPRPHCLPAPPTLLCRCELCGQLYQGDFTDPPPAPPRHPVVAQLQVIPCREGGWGRRGRGEQGSDSALGWGWGGPRPLCCPRAAPPAQPRLPDKPPPLEMTAQVDNADRRIVLLADPETGNIVARVVIPPNGDLRPDLERLRLAHALAAAEEEDEEDEEGEARACRRSGLVAAALLLVFMLGAFAWIAAASEEGA